jgi:hypothetical protein
MSNIFELATEVPFEAELKCDLLTDKFSEVKRLDKGETIFITQIDVDISMKWWYDIDRIVINGIVKRTFEKDKYKPIDYNKPIGTYMFEEKNFDFSVHLPNGIDISEFMEVL